MYGQIRRRLTAHEIDIKDLEAAVRGQGQESPQEEIARLRRVKVEPDPFDLDISKEVRSVIAPSITLSNSVQNQNLFIVIMHTLLYT